MDTTKHPAACCCNSIVDTVQKQATPKVKRTAKSIPGFLLSVGIVFFPKCPLCWAAYMSMFGGIGLSGVPYMKWLLPVLVVFLGLHLYFIFRKVKERGYGPFVCSLAGSAMIICCRMFFAEVKVLLFLGMFLVLAGSLWNNFSSSFKINQRSFCKPRGINL